MTDALDHATLTALFGDIADMLRERLEALQQLQSTRALDLVVSVGVYGDRLEVIQNRMHGGDHTIYVGPPSSASAAFRALDAATNLDACA